MTYYPNFIRAITTARVTLETTGIEVDPGRWQGVPTAGRPDLRTKEITNWRADVPVGGRGPDSYGSHLAPAGLLNRLRDEIQPNLPWADDHFEERVSRVPSNPGEQYKNWPWWQGQFDQTVASIKRDPQGNESLGEATHRFTHTYQERFWPKQAGDPWVTDEDMAALSKVNRGLRYEYGDLDDVVDLLLREPYTRQATFPIFFPEDTGAAHGGRVPCTLHYHFLMRDNRLDLFYPIRSCDFVRHLRDDLYMACRLMLWVLEELERRELEVVGLPYLWPAVQPGYLYFTAYSLHYHKGDMHHVAPR